MNSLSVTARRVGGTMTHGGGCVHHSDRQRSRSAPLLFQSRLAATDPLIDPSPRRDRRLPHNTRASAGAQLPDDPQEPESADCALGALPSGGNMLRTSSGMRSKPQAIVVRLLRR